MCDIGRLARGLGLCLALSGGSAAATAGECELVLGAALSLTGKLAASGLHLKNGYDFAVDQLNEAGGVEISERRCTFRIVYYDAQSEPARAAELARRLIGQDKVQYLLGPHGAELTAAIVPVAEEHGVPLLAAADLDRALLAEEHARLFATPGLSARQFGQVAELAAETARRAGGDPAEVRVAMAFAADAYSLDLRQGLVEAMASHGMKTVLDARLPDDLADMGATLALIKGLRPDVLVVSGREKGAATAIRQIRDLGVSVPMIAVTHCEAADIVGAFGGAADGILCPSPWAPEAGHADPLFGSAADYADAFRTAYPEYAAAEVPYQAARASATVLVLADAFRRAGSLDPETLCAALAETEMTSFYGLVGFSEKARGTVRPTLIRQVQDGAYRIVAPRELATGELRYPRP